MTTTYRRTALVALTGLAFVQTGCVSSSIPSPADEPFGFQSGTDNKDAESSSYATSMVYNDLDREILITGGTYGSYFNVSNNEEWFKDSESDCFVAILHLPRAESDATRSNANSLSWIRRKQFGTPGVQDYCSGLEVDPVGNMYVVGHSGDGGVLSSLLPYGNYRREIYGTILSLNDDVELLGGHLMHSSKIQYPVAIESDSNFERFFVATIMTESDTIRIDGEDLSTSRRIYRGGPDLAITGYRLPIYGDNFSLQLQCFTRDGSMSGGTGLVDTMHKEWTREFGTDTLDDVQVSSLLYVSEDAFLLGGYTVGTGTAFGYPQNSSTSALDGFITKFDPMSGSILASKRIETDNSSSNERVLAICRQQGSYSDEVFIVGTTDGILDTNSTNVEGSDVAFKGNHAFLMKFDSFQMETIWTRELGGVYLNQSESNGENGPQVHGMACVVTPDGEHVYIGGTVKDGASISIPDGPRYESAGADDIFIGLYRSSDGTLEFAKQVGTSEDDSLAQGNSLATDAVGNLIVLGNTRGSFYREKVNKGIADLFVMSVGRENGNFLDPIELRNNGVSTSSENQNGFDEGPESENEYDDHGTAVLISEKSEGKYRSDKKRSNSMVAIAVLLIASVVLVALAAIVHVSRRNQEIKESLEGVMRESFASRFSRGAYGSRRSENLNYSDPKDIAGSFVAPKWSSIGQASQVSSLQMEDATSISSLSQVGSRRVIDDGDLIVGKAASPGLGKADDDNFDELFELLSQASDQLSPHAGSGHRNPRHASASSSRRKHDQGNSLDDIWDRGII